MLIAPPLDEVEVLEEELESAVAVASVVTVPVPAVPASFIWAEQVPVALVVALVVADPAKLQAEAARSCST
jgi:hypothetical protein